MFANTSRFIINSSDQILKYYVYVYLTMPKVTEKYQVTIPKEVREKIGLKPGEELEVIPLNDNEILLRRKVEKIKNPLKVLLGSSKEEEIPPEKIDELGEE
ncbi:hypothetical protein HS5_28460 [Acidianus sp. HS-5]|nr:hypothetical protein HS5_28460 [Acidianus sp. HS-5]